jgi:hypothetical protein
MVTEEEFQRAQVAISSTGKGKKAEHRSLPFAGLFRCAKCGCAVVGETRTKSYRRRPRTVDYVYYHCSGSRGCPKAAVRQEDLQNVIHQTIKSMRLDRDTADWLADSLPIAMEQQVGDVAAGISKLQRSAEQDELRLRNLSRMRMDGEIELAEFQALRGEILVRQADVRERTHMARTRNERANILIRSKLQACVAAGEIDNLENDPKVLAKVMQLAGKGALNLSPFDYRLEPILSKIAAFEPLRDGSERPKRGDLLTSFPIWWNLLDDLLNLASEELDSWDAQCAVMTPQDRRWFEKNGFL